MSRAYAAALAALAEADPDVVVMTAENRAHLNGIPERLGSRFVDVGIAEQTLVGAAAGLALRGRKPVVHALAAFLTMRAFEFIRTDVGLAGLPVTLVGYVPGFLSEANGPTHQAVEDVALMRAIPGMQIVCPADEAELVQALAAVVASRTPSYIRFCAAPPVVTGHARFELGRAETLRAGDGVTLLTYGLLVGVALAAAERLEARAVPARVVNLRSLVPIDAGAVLAAARETSLLVTLEDHRPTGGLHSIVAELLVAHGLGRRTLALGIGDRGFRPALLDDALACESFTPNRIAGRVIEALLAPALGKEACRTH